MKRKPRRHRDPMRDEYADYYEDEVRLEDRKKKRREKAENSKFQLPPTAIHLMVLASIGILLLGLLWATAGGPVLEKTLQALAAPLGILWLGLFAVTYFCLLNRLGFPALVSFSCWALLTLCGNAIFSGLIIDSLQGRYDDFDVNSLQKMDVVVVLGGGQMTTPVGTSQISDAGDRLILAVQLFRLGKVDRIICTGTSGLPLADGEKTQADAGAEILISLGVPKDKILKIGGRNTIQEMQALDDWISSNEATKLRKGIITSAWHLPRAMRLAESVGIVAEPIPADFSNTQLKSSPDLLIPSSDNLHQVTFCLKEYLAKLVGR